RADELDRQAAAAVADAERFARSSAVPDPGTALDFVIKPRLRTANRLRTASQPAPASAGPPISTARLIRQALQDAMEDDASVFLAGIDVGGGNVFGITRGLKDRWPDRVLDTPISETAVMGLAVGSAMAGLRPVVELMYLDFIGVCLDQVL